MSKNKLLSDELIKELEAHFSYHDTDAICNVLNAFAQEDTNSGELTFEDWLNIRFVVTVDKPAEKLYYKLTDTKVDEALVELLSIENDKIDFHDILWPAMPGRAVMHLNTICNWLKMPHSRPVHLNKLNDKQFMNLLSYLLHHMYWNSLKRVEQFDIINNLNYNTRRLNKEK
jgi:hypothetical protein